MINNLPNIINKLSSHRSNQKLIECALNHGLDINSLIFDGFTLLDNALLLSDKDMIEFLLIKGSNPNLLNKYGQLPLEKALDENIIKILLSFDAKLEKENAYKRTPLMQNLWQGNFEKAVIFYHLGAKINKIKWSEVEPSIYQKSYDYFTSQMEKDKLENLLLFEKEKKVTVKKNEEKKVYKL